MDNVGQKIRKLRELRNYTQEYMALNLNITQTAYCKIEKEESRLTVTRLKEIAQILDVEPLQLLTFDERLFIPSASFNKREKRLLGGDNTNRLYQQEAKDEQLNIRMKQMESEIVMLRSLLANFNPNNFMAMAS